MRAVRHVQAASYNSWQAAAWFLERSFPERYGRRLRPTVEEPTQRTSVGVTSISVDELGRKLLLLVEEEDIQTSRPDSPLSPSPDRMRVATGGSA
jgi:hypothetical protein